MPPTIDEISVVLCRLLVEAHRNESAAQPLEDVVGCIERVAIAERRRRDQHGVQDAPERSLDRSPPAMDLVDLVRARVLRDAASIGAAYERLLDAPEMGATRRTRGVFYTPPTLARHVVRRCVPKSDGRSPAPTVLDPACGCGVFLSEAARLLVAQGHDTPAALGALRGVDRDPFAVRLCRLALWLEFGDPGGEPDSLSGSIRCGDSLLGVPPDWRPAPGSEAAAQAEEWMSAQAPSCVAAGAMIENPLHWPLAFPELIERGGFDAVVGNPPFLNPLARSTAISRAESAILQARIGTRLAAYTNPAACFLQLAASLTRPGGTFGMVLPVSVLAARDAAPIREWIIEVAAPASLWLDTEGVFDAAVRTCAMTFRHSASAEPVDLFVGQPLGQPTGSAQPAGPHWGELGASAVGVPAVRRCAPTRTLEDLASITAGFRDEFYAVLPGIRESAGDDDLHPRLITCGLIDPFRSRWGSAVCRAGGVRYEKPVVETQAGSPALARLASAQSIPKLLIATQTRVMEVMADPTGDCLALTPVIQAVPRPGEDLWLIGAALASPLITVRLASGTFGTARSLSSIKPSARELRACGFPTNEQAWTRASELFRSLCASEGPLDRDCLEEFGRESGDSYGLAATEREEVLGWWLARMPARCLAASSPGSSR